MKIEKAVLRDVSPSCPLWKVWNHHYLLCSCGKAWHRSCLRYWSGQHSTWCGASHSWCWCWCCIWHYRESSPKGIVCLKISPWLSVTRSWDVSHFPWGSIQMQTQHSSTFKWLQGTCLFIFSPSPLLHFGSLLLPEGGAHEVLGGKVWLSEVGYSCYSLCIHSADQPHGPSLLATFKARHIWKAHFFC